jgi:16S rRNA processing protein RimM
MLTDVIVGVVGRAHGVRGEVFVDAHTDEPQLRFAPGRKVHPANDDPAGPAELDSSSALGHWELPAELTIRSARRHQQRWLIAFDELADRSAAESLRGASLMIQVLADERPAGTDEYYDRHLIGLSVCTGGRPAGVIRSVLHQAGQDVLEIEVSDQLRLVPFVAALVPDVDLGAGTVTIADVPGLLADETTGRPGSGARQEEGP